MRSSFSTPLRQTISKDTFTIEEELHYVSPHDETVVFFYIKSILKNILLRETIK